jgi:sulfate transport system ATP-binding protein
LHDELHVTSIFVTHDQEEAFAVADRVVVMRGGRVEQSGTPAEVFDRPANAFVMDFLGNVNVFHGRVRNGVADVAGLQVAAPDHTHPESRPASVYVRPHELDILHGPHLDTSMKARVVHVNGAGSVTRVQLQALGSEQTVHVELGPERTAELDLKAGQTVFVAPRRAHVFVPDYTI